MYINCNRCGNELISRGGTYEEGDTNQTTNPENGCKGKQKEKRNSRTFKPHLIRRIRN